MRIARSLGDVSLLLPEGVDGLADCPFPLHNAILAAFHWLSFEEWPISDRPPKRIWLDEKKLAEWWEAVDKRKKDEFKTGDEPDEDDFDMNEIELVTRG